MKYLKSGMFYGNTFNSLVLDSITLTDTEYTHSRVDWHYHENTYFTFLLEGRLIEINKKETHVCGPGTLLYHNCQEPHYNIKPEGYSRGFHVEISNSWLSGIAEEGKFPEGSFSINNPEVISLFRKIHNELSSGGGSFEIEELLYSVNQLLSRRENCGVSPKPIWAKNIIEILNDELAGKLFYKDIAVSIGIHPVQLSRDFKKYFGCSMGEYVRKLKIQKAINLMHETGLSLTEISHQCGFADQSHFIKWFRCFTGSNPLHFRKNSMIC